MNLTFLKKLKPHFWDHHDVAAGSGGSYFNFRRKWILVFVLTTVVALIPLLVISLINFRVTRDAIESEVTQRAAQQLTATWRTFSYFLSERRSALEFVLRDNRLDELSDPGRLAVILNNLKHGLGGFVDIATIDSSGGLVAYAGPSHPGQENYCKEKCFQQVVKRGFYISEPGPGRPSLQQIVMALRHDQPDGSFLVLRTTLNIQIFEELLSQLELDKGGDAFIINQKGLLQTKSRYYGNPPVRAAINVPDFSDEPQIVRDASEPRKPLLIGYAYIPDTSFILMTVQPENQLMQPWYQMRMKLIGLLVFCVAVVLIAIFCMATYLIHRIHAADRKRIIALHQVEYTNKMTSIGRLAAGVAHEVNNPLAVINEKAGLLKDLITLNTECIPDPRVPTIVDNILSEVGRCGRVTRRLLNFARHADIRIESLQVSEVINDTLAFLRKEAEHRRISFSANIAQNVGPIESDRGSLEQILLNLLNNSFAAMDDGGHLDIMVEQDGDNQIKMTVSDNGCGIAQEDLKRIFEPFFTSKSRQGSTGLGLSVTYGMVKQLGGRIEVRSQVGKGTQFDILLPVTLDENIRRDLYQIA